MTPTELDVLTEYAIGTPLDTIVQKLHITLAEVLYITTGETH